MSVTVNVRLWVVYAGCNAMIIEMDFPHSQALQHEMAVWEKGCDGTDLDALIESHPTVESYTREFLALPEGMEPLLRIKELAPTRATILEIGPGTGEVALAAAALGHDLSVVEPSLGLCRRIEFLADAYGLKLAIYNSTAEHMRQISGLFDLIVFNRSLHHCDDPLRALKDCCRLLRPGGKLLLCNEPILPAFRSKQWFYARLESHPDEMGHYGGNEHTYRHHEYLAMVRDAGFSRVESQLNVRNTDYQLVCGQLKSRSYCTTRFLLPRMAWFGLVTGLHKLGTVSKPIFAVLKSLSLLHVTFIGTR